jgi:hypothetical protein
MTKNSTRKLAHTITISFAALLVLSTAIVYGVIKNSPLPNQKSVAGVNEVAEKATNPQKKQRNQSQEEYLKRQEEVKNKD